MDLSSVVGKVSFIDTPSVFKAGATVEGKVSHFFKHWVSWSGLFSGPLQPSPSLCWWQADVPKSSTFCPFCSWLSTGNLVLALSPVPTHLGPTLLKSVLLFKYQVHCNRFWSWYFHIQANVFSFSDQRNAWHVWIFSQGTNKMFYEFNLYVLRVRALPPHPQLLLQWLLTSSREHSLRTPSCLQQTPFPISLFIYFFLFSSNRLKLFSSITHPFLTSKWMCTFSKGTRITSYRGTSPQTMRESPHSQLTQQGTMETLT